MKDIPSMIAEHFWDSRSTLTETEFRGNLARAIRRAVKAERERCVKCVKAEATAAMVGKRFVSAYQIITAINTPAKKRPSRKRK